MLGNTYHLHFRPGEDADRRARRPARLHGWDGPILTDSGGFQVFSLRDTLLASDDDGVTFRSVYDGNAERLHARARGARSRSDSARTSRCASTSARPRACRARSSRRRYAARRLGGAPARRCRAHRGQLRFAITQGGLDTRAPRRSIEELVALDFDGYAIGGLSVGEHRAPMFDATTHAASFLPPEKPRYFMGIGDPEGVIEVIARGVDMFDCVLPTRTARTGSALTWEGRLNLRNARFARDPRPLDEAARARRARGSAGRTSAISSISRRFSAFAS